MSLEIRVASRTDLSKKGLIDAIMQIFTDNDTNGENGPDYLSFEAAMHYGISSEKYYQGSWKNDFTADELENMTNDNYLIAFLTNYAGDEESLVKEAFCIYSPSMGSCIEREQSYNVVCNQDGQITAVAYACY